LSFACRPFREHWIGRREGLYVIVRPSEKGTQSNKSFDCCQTVPAFASAPALLKRDFRNDSVTSPALSSIN
jgi:hypothetical protein